MTKQEIYEQVVRLTGELQRIDVAKKIFNTAKEGDSKKVEEVFETFKKENPNLYERIVKFGNEYKNLWKMCRIFEDAYIFGTEENQEKGIYVLDTAIIDSLSLYVLMFLVGMDEMHMFQWNCKSSHIFQNAIAEAGYNEIADFVTYYSWIDFIQESEDEEDGLYSNLNDLLVEIFKGSFKDQD